MTTDTPRRRLGVGTIIALFFATLIGFNVAFYIIAVSNPPTPVEAPTAPAP